MRRGWRMFARALFCINRRLLNCILYLCLFRTNNSGDGQHQLLSGAVCDRAADDHRRPRSWPVRPCARQSIDVPQFRVAPHSTSHQSSPHPNPPPRISGAGATDDGEGVFGLGGGGVVLLLVIIVAAIALILGGIYGADGACWLGRLLRAWR